MSASKKPTSPKDQLTMIESYRKLFKSYLTEAAGDELAGASGAPVGGAPAAAPAAPAPQAPQITPDQNMGQPLDPNAPADPNAAGAAVQYTVEQFIDSMNKIRGGKSFDDQNVYQQITTMFNGLTDQDKQTLSKVITQVQAIVQPAPTSQGQAPGQEQLPSETNTAGFQANVNAPAGAPPAVPASLGGGAELPPA